MKNINYFVTAGCSFSACSSDPDKYNNEPEKWPQWLCRRIHPKIFNNLAITSGGNYSIATNLVYYLETKKYINPLETLIGINITGLDRVDIICPVNHPDSNPYFSWAQDFGYNWLNYSGFLASKPPFGNSLQKNIGHEQLIIMNCVSIVQCFTYLESKNFDYFFMLMDKTIIEDCPEWFQKFIDERADKWIKFGQYQDMHSFSKNLGLLMPDNFHPTPEAHRLIAEEIYRHYY